MERLYRAEVKKTVILEFSDLSNSTITDYAITDADGKGDSLDMLIGHVEGATRIIGKAQGYRALPVKDEIITVLVGNSERDVPSMVTVWFPTPQEIERLQKGAPIHLRLLGNAHPAGDARRRPGAGLTIEWVFGRGCSASVRLRRRQRRLRPAPAISAWTVGLPVWTPHNYKSFAREAYVQNAVAYRCIKLIAAENACIGAVAALRQGREGD